MNKIYLGVILAVCVVIIIGCCLYFNQSIVNEPYVLNCLEAANKSAYDACNYINMKIN